VRKIGFLGVIIRPNRIEIEKEKVNRVLSWPEPKNVKDVRKFLDLANYYRRFIKDFSQKDLHNETSIGSPRFRQRI